MNTINIKFSSEHVVQAEKGTPFHEIIQKAFPKRVNDIYALEIEGALVGLQEKAESDMEASPVYSNEQQGLHVLWHSASHLMAAAFKSLFPEVQFGIGPAVSNGFYYDIKLERAVTPEDFPAIEAKMLEIANMDIPFEKSQIPKEKALTIFTELDEPFKIELINDIPDETVSLYKNGDLFLDLCRGPHVLRSGMIKNFKILSVAGAYWRGDERNAVLQRIYGIAFPDSKSLKNHLRMLEEAAKRDHRKLGKELNLFSFQAEGPGFPFWHPSGMHVYNEIMAYMRDTLSEKGYGEIKTPVILNDELWHRSGHWDNYKENMYFTVIDDKDYAVKPMNCPGCLLVYKNQLHSYRELPIKFSEMGLVHRHEKSGVLHGLFRVRQFTQDDAHVFCTPAQMEQEIINLIDLIYEVYNTFGFDSVHVELSTRPDKSIGAEEVWQKAQTALTNALAVKQIKHDVNRGGGAFYGPKIDFHIKDSLGRLWQCGTIQVDFSMPERFDLEYTGEDGARHRPVMIHRAILGSIERFIGILIEHYAGAFPAWLAPVQCIVIPVSEKHHEYAAQITDNLIKYGIRCENDARNEKMGYKIRESEKRKIPYMCIVGDQEVIDKNLSVRKRRAGDLGKESVEKFIEQLLNEIKRRANN